ncbi:MAG: hypothetical protein WBD25_03515 [Terriglobales bacterium]|jgi:hypothetical protein
MTKTTTTKIVAAFAHSPEREKEVGSQTIFTTFTTVEISKGRLHQGRYRGHRNPITHRK